ncbi:MAG: hypothetical protein H6838_16410 [Planctomycetes bacterium]|nr:hypothetical protein [Planctomycetota bacterium]
MSRTESSALPHAVGMAARTDPFVLAAWLLWCAVAGAGLGVVHGCCEVLWPALLVSLGAACCARALTESAGGRTFLAGLVVAAVAAVAVLGLARDATWPGPAELLAGAVAIGAAFGRIVGARAAPRTSGELAAAIAGAALAAAAAHYTPLAWSWFGPQAVVAAPLFGLLLLLPLLAEERASGCAGAHPTDRLAVAVALVALVGLGLWGTDDAAALPWRVAPAVLLLHGAALPSRRLVALGAVAALAAAPMIGGGAALPSRYTTLQRDGRATAVYDRATQELQLRWDDVILDGAGPDRPLPQLLATLLRAALLPGDRVLLVGLGCGRLPAALAEAGIGEVDALSLRAVSPALRARLQLDGPVPLPAGSAPVAMLPCAHDRPWRAQLRRLPAGSRQAIVIGEPLHELATAQVTFEVQRDLRRVAGAGLVLQPFWLDRVPCARLQALLAAAAAAHAWNGVFAVGDCGVLVSAGAPPDFAARGAWSDWPASARWLAHRAHLGGAADADLARLIVVDAAAVPAAVSEFDALPALGAVDRGEVLALLARAQGAPPDAASLPRPADDSLFAGWSRVEAETRRAVATIRTLDGEALGMAAAWARAQQLAAASLPRGAPRAELQAALGLPGADGVPLLDPGAAALRAHSIDPTLFHETPRIFADLPRPKASAGDLEDLARLPEPDRLAELASGTDAFATALRARFPSDCARALLARLQAGPLDEGASVALRELADPFVLAEAGRVVGVPARRAELLAWWRGDLPMPVALQPLVVEAPLRLAAALPRRRDARAMLALADLLLSDDLQVRIRAAAALRDGPGAAIAYDPEGPPEQRISAAARLRSLHNRAP